LPIDTSVARAVSSKSAVVRARGGRPTADHVFAWVLDGKSVLINGEEVSQQTKSVIRRLGFRWFSDNSYENIMSIEIEKSQFDLLFLRSEINDISTAKDFLKEMNVGEIGRIRFEFLIEAGDNVVGSNKGHILFLQRISDESILVYDPALGVYYMDSDATAVETKLKEALEVSCKSYLDKYKRALKLPTDGPLITLSKRAQIISNLEKQINQIFGVTDLSDFKVRLEAYTVMIRK